MAERPSSRGGMGLNVTPFLNFARELFLRKGLEQTQAIERISKIRILAQARMHPFIEGRFPLMTVSGQVQTERMRKRSCCQYSRLAPHSRSQFAAICRLERRDVPASPIGNHDGETVERDQSTTPMLMRPRVDSGHLPRACQGGAY